MRTWDRERSFQLRGEHLATGMTSRSAIELGVEGRRHRPEQGTWTLRAEHLNAEGEPARCDVFGCTPARGHTGKTHGRAWCVCPARDAYKWLRGFGVALHHPLPHLSQCVALSSTRRPRHARTFARTAVALVHAAAGAAGSRPAARRPHRTRGGTTRMFRSVQRPSPDRAHQDLPLGGR